MARRTRSDTLSAAADLEGRAQVGDVLLAQRDQRLRLMADGGLEAGEGEMRLRPSQHGSRQREALRPRRCKAACSTAGPPGKPEAQQLGGLVEGFAQRVVDGGAEPLVAADIVHDEELGVAARDQQQQVGRQQPLGEADGERVRLQVVDRHQRQAVHQRDRLGRRDADQQAADQAGPGRHRHRIEARQADAGMRARPRPMISSRHSTWARAAISGTTPP